MPGIAQLNVEWLNLNSQRSYPLTEFATGVDQSGDLTLPNDFILALYFPVHAGMDITPGKFFLRQISVFGAGYNIAIAYDDGTSTPPIVASAIIAKSTHEEYDEYALPGRNDFSDSSGQLVIGKTTTIDNLAAGTYTFDFAGGALEVDAIRPMLDQVQAIILVNGDEASEPLYGDIEITAGTNVRLTPTIVSGQNPEVRVDAIDGEGLNEDCVCIDDAPCIRTIGGVAPTAAGDITITGDDCLEVQTAANGLRLVDNCSNPCCGCEEWEALTAEINILGTAATTTQNFANRLEGQVNRFHTTVLGSRLSDDGCFTCDT